MFQFEEAAEEPENDPVRWGILGPGLIARTLMSAFSETPGASVVAVASRDGQRAAAFANDFGIPRAYDSYQTLLDDPEVEAVYIALPNHLHAEWAIKAAAAGKHILCEKPLSHTLAEAKRMVAAAEAADVLLLEAIMYRYHPRMRELAEMLARGAIGPVRLLRASFCFMMADAENYRNRPEMGGGALLDVGSYCVSVARWLTNEEPISALAAGTLLESGADESLSGVLTFPSGALAQIQCSFGTAEHQMLDLVGLDGAIQVPTPFTAWRNDDTALRITRAGQTEEILYEPTNPYAMMLAHFNDCLREQDDPWWPPEDGLGTMRAMEALRRAMSSGRSERV